MLVLHPNSRCDVCLEGYHGPRDPIAISCGHIFCQWCVAFVALWLPRTSLTTIVLRGSRQVPPVPTKVRLPFVQTEL